MVKCISFYLLATYCFALIPGDNLSDSFNTDHKWKPFYYRSESAMTEDAPKSRDVCNGDEYRLQEDFPADSIPQTGSIPYNITRGKRPGISDMIVVIYSGDGGWYKFEQSIANRLANIGVTVIGIDIKKYLRNRMTPAKAASDLTDLLRLYVKEWGKSRYVLFGYSQGAEIIPFIFTRLPGEISKNVSSLVMLSPDISTDFEVHLSNMIGLGNKQNTYNVIKELSGIQKTRQIIIFGDNEKTKVPDLLKKTHAEIFKIPGDHHYNGNASLIVGLLRDKKLFDY